MHKREVLVDDRNHEVNVISAREMHVLCWTCNLCDSACAKLEMSRFSESLRRSRSVWDTPSSSMVLWECMRGVELVGDGWRLGVAGMSGGWCWRVLTAANIES